MSGTIYTKQSTSRQRHSFACDGTIKKKGGGGGTVLAAYLANKQHFVPFHPIKALDRPKTQAAPPSWQTSCHKAALEHALLLKPPTSKPGTP